MATPTSTLGIMDLGMKSAVFTKFKDLLGITKLNDGVIYMPYEVALREFAEKKGDQLVDFISVWRQSTQFSWDRQRTPLARQGINVSYLSEAKEGVLNVKAVPVDIEYEIVFWMHDLDAMNALIERYMFWLHQDSNLNVTIQDQELDFDLGVGSLQDLSTIKNMYQVGKYFVFKGVIKLEGWLLKFTNDGGVIRTIDCTVYFKQEGVEKDIELFNFTLT